MNQELMIQVQSDSNNMNFVLIGAGNLGTTLTRALIKKGFQPVQIINRSIDKANRLAEETGNPLVSSDSSHIEPCDFVIVAVSDDSIPTVLEKIPSLQAPVFHCSGSTGISVFSDKFHRYGVFYPLQSFSSLRKINFREIPVLIEASDQSTLKLLRSVAEKLSENVMEVNSENRIRAHIAAVFASNFTNHFLLMARDYLRVHNLPDNIIDPLVRETFNRAIEMKNENVQTGPAVREDRKILSIHEEILKNDPSLQKIYNFVSESIIRYKKEKESN